MKPYYRVFFCASCKTIYSQTEVPRNEITELNRWAYKEHSDRYQSVHRDYCTSCKYKLFGWNLSETQA